MAARHSRAPAIATTAPLGLRFHKRVAVSTQNRIQAPHTSLDVVWVVMAKKAAVRNSFLGGRTALLRASPLGTRRPLGLVGFLAGHKARANEDEQRLRDLGQGTQQRGGFVYVDTRHV